MLSILLLFVVLIAVILRKSLVKPKGYPPGPVWLPLIGCNLIVDRLTLKYRSQWKALSQLAKDYKTQVLGLKLGHELVVVIYGHKLIRQSLMMKEFDGRPDTYFLNLRTFGKRAGVVFTEGPLWKEQRQFMVEQLLDVGFGKTDLQLQIQHENLAIVERIKSFHQKPIKIRSLVASPYMNILWKYMAGENVPGDKLKGMLEMFYDRQKAFNMAGGWLNMYPWLRFVFPVMSGYNFIMDINKQIKEVFDAAIKDHRERKVEGKDFIYTYLQEMDENKENYTEDQLRGMCLDLVIASACTINMLEYIFLAVLRHPEHQEKIYDEIKNLVGDRVPCWNDSFRLTYTQAFLLEVQRFYNVAPMLGPRRTTNETEIGGYRIPQETTVMMSVGDLYYDPATWKNPRVFDPSRFIDEKGEFRTELTENFFTFGKGRRRCPGDSLAKSFVFITFTGIMNKFRVSPANGRIPSDETEIGLLSQPKAYKAVFTPRD